MKVDDVRAKIASSKEILELARRYAAEAAELPENDEKRKGLEELAKRLIAQARTLTEAAKKLV